MPAFDYPAAPMHRARASRVARTAKGACIGVLVAACSGESALGPAEEPRVDLGVGGGLRVSIAGERRLVVASDDGRVLLDGLPPASVAAEAPPLVGFAVRDATTTYEMQFGSFKPTEIANGPWRVASRLARASTGEGGAVAVDLEDGAGAKLARLSLAVPEPGHLVVDLAPGDGPERRLSWGFACDEGDRFAGFGAQTWDTDHRGQTVPAFVQEQGVGKSETDDYDGAWFLQGRRHSSHLPIPQYLARRGYVLTVESDLRSVFALCSESDSAARVELDLPARLHVFDGPRPSEAIERATATFGRPRMPPRVAFAPWADAIFGSENVRAVAKKLRDEKIPVSVIWTEDWRGGEWEKDDYRLEEEWEVDTSLYPDFPDLADELHDLGFHFHVYFNPFVYVGSKAWDETQPKGWLVKREDGSDYVFTGAKFTETGLLDLDNPDARAWAVGKMRAAMELGADGWMNDFAEWLPTDGVTAAGPSLARHNVYPVLWQEVAREAIDGMNDGKERLFFGRSGWFGTPALADVVWAGDQRTTMDPDDGLPTIIPIGVGLGVVGISTYGHDIAGYQAATNEGSTKEVFFRWTELGAWSPVMRTHHGAQPKKNWSFQSDAETIAHFRRYAELHMSLVPFFEGLARVAADTGMPIWRGLALEFPDDPAAWPITDEVTVGGVVLVAPVEVPGAASRSVYLPEGRWYPWSGGQAEIGPATVEVSAPLGEIPVFARAGAIVPAFPGGVMTLVNGSSDVPDASSVGDDRIVYAFLGASGAFREAGGLAYAIEHVADASGDVAHRWEGEDVPECPSPAEPPCVEVESGVDRVRVTGPGTLEIVSGGATVARVTAEGGAPSRRLSFVVRR